jgi:phage tail-like protein
VPAGLGPNQPNDALTAARFSITIDGYEIAAFSELKGISTRVQSVDFRESTDKEIIIKRLPGQPDYSDIILARGMCQSMELFAWHEAVRHGNMAAARKSCSLVMYNYDGKPVARFHMENAWPSKIEIGAMKAGSNEVLMETVTIVCENLQRVSA